MKKISFLHLAAILFYASIVNLSCMPEATEMPTEETYTTEMPAADTSAVIPVANQAAIPPTPPTPAVSTMPGSTTPTEEVKPEQLGEFEIKEDQAEFIKNRDPKIVELYKNISNLSNQINDVTNEIQKIRDDFFNKFSEINEKLDAFYQKIGIESGKAQEFLKEQK